MNDEKTQHFRFDMVGNWKSIWNGADCSYHLRLTVETGTNGEHIWRGTESDQPFWVNQSTQADAAMIEEMASMPSHSRLCLPLTYPLSTSLEAIQERGGSLMGDEIPICGIIQWKISEEEGNEEFLNSYHVKTDGIERKLALEFVSGCYSPSIRRLVLHGTHMSNAGKGAIGRDVYDLIVSEDFQSISGVSQSNDSFETARVTVTKIDDAACHTVDGVDFASVRDRDLKQKKAYNAAAAALESIKDIDAREYVMEAQKSMFDAAISGNEEFFEGRFVEMKEVGRTQSDRLNKLISICMEKYHHLKERYSYLESIENRKGYEQMPLPDVLKGETPADKVRALLAIAKYKEPKFREKIGKLVTSVNKAALHPDEYPFEKFCEDYNLDASTFPFGFESAICLPNFQKITVAQCRFGPPKGFERALTKVKEDGKSLKDLNRATIIFEDPYVMGIVYQAIKATYKLVTVKNKLCNHDGGGYKQPPDLHLIIDLDDDGWLVEIQLMFCDILKIKKEMHKFYEIVRASSAIETLSPIFQLDLQDNDITH